MSPCAFRGRHDDWIGKCACLSGIGRIGANPAGLRIVVTPGQLVAPPEREARRLTFGAHRPLACEANLQTCPPATISVEIDHKYASVGYLQIRPICGQCAGSTAVAGPLPLVLDRPGAPSALCPVWSALCRRYSSADCREPSAARPAVAGDLGLVRTWRERCPCSALSRRQWPTPLAAKCPSLRAIAECIVRSCVAFGPETWVGPKPPPPTALAPPRLDPLRTCPAGANRACMCRRAC